MTHCPRCEASVSKPGLCEKCRGFDRLNANSPTPAEARAAFDAAMAGANAIMDLEGIAKHMWQAALAYQASAQQGVGEGWAAGVEAAAQWHEAEAANIEELIKTEPWPPSAQTAIHHRVCARQIRLLSAAPSPAGERLTEEECEAMDSILLGSANLDYLDLSSCAETIAKALSRLTKTGGA